MGNNYGNNEYNMQENQTYLDYNKNMISPDRALKLKLRYLPIEMEEINEESMESDSAHNTSKLLLS